MDSEVHFYRDVLGLALRFPQGYDDYSHEMWVEFELGACILALHGGAEMPPGDQHEIIFWVDDVALARESIIAAGFRMNPVRDLEDGHPISEGRDPDGHRFAIRS